MTHHIDTALIAISTVGSAILGSQIFKSVSVLLADNTQMNTSELFQMIIGPAGALIGLIIALKWMAGRLDATEKKVEKREAERDVMVEKMITVVTQNTNAFENVHAQNQQIVNAMERQASAVNNLIAKNS